MCLNMKCNISLSSLLNWPNLNTYIFFFFNFFPYKKCENLSKNYFYKIL